MKNLCVLDDGQCQINTAWHASVGTSPHSSFAVWAALFLFALYVAVNVRVVPTIDAVGFNGVANAQSVAAWPAIGLAVLVGG